jgi:Holliday junction resolvasome RuvABC endonuclease subunit
MKILGLDLATCSGFAIINEKEEILLSGTYQLYKKDSHHHKLIDFKNFINNLISINQPDIIVIENVFQGVNCITTAFLNQLRGVAISSIPQDKELLLVSASSCRKYVLGKGNLSKKEVFQTINERFNLNYSFSRDNDITDAILLSLYGLKIIQAR